MGDHRVLTNFLVLAGNVRQYRKRVRTLDARSEPPVPGLFPSPLPAGRPLRARAGPYVALVTLLALAVLVGVGAWTPREEAKPGRGGGQITVGDCLNILAADDIEEIACSSADADGRVVRVIDGATDGGRGCPQEATSYVEERSSESGRVEKTYCFTRN
ncbi:MAG: hypothetical protein ICV64_01690 [Thermoleophilia bacterium]|nr:hypothetical protein [Thermoleophilia bacterium]